MVVAPGSGRQRPTHPTEDKLTHLHTTYRTPLTNYVNKLLFGDRPAAEDIIQETFTRAWRHLNQHHDTDITTLRPWLYTVARRLVIDTLRARRARPTEVTIEKLGPLPTTDDTPTRIAETDRMHRALQHLTPEHRTVLIELYYHDQTFDEVAQQLGIPTGTVRSRSHYAKQALRKLLHEDPT
jgi:RNA polymerase sigma-70 factor (ECF subfamily)